MTIVPVDSAARKKQFLGVVDGIYAGQPNYVRPLDMDIEEVFDVKKNTYFQHGECTRWVLLNAQGKPIGRVAAFINHRNAQTFDQPTGGMGFFECVEDDAAAFFLFDTCKAWLEARGMQAMDGPINFGDRDAWWGCLLGPHDLPLYRMNYSMPYYPALFEGYGFQVYFKQHTYLRDIMAPLNPVVVGKAERILRNPAYTFRHIEKKRVNDYVPGFVDVYNKGWANFDNFTPMTEAGALQVFNSLKYVIDENLIWFAYYNDQPIGFYVMVPDINSLVQRVKGRSDWVGKLQMFYLLRFRKQHIRKIFGLVFGITPRFQGRGVEAALVQSFANHFWPMNRFDEIEMDWIGDFNPAMSRVAEQMGGTMYKTHLTYRYLFDRTKPFKRAPILQAIT